LQICATEWFSQIHIKPKKKKKPSVPKNVFFYVYE
jgi:hypothetical protein